MNSTSRSPRPGRSRKQRADVALVERGLVDSRSRAQSLIMAGQVFSGSQRIDKAGQLLASDAPLHVTETSCYVSRGGDKLEGALVDLSVQCQGLVCVDVGASTGGFSDCLLQHGARKVYAVDVGQGQLAHKLRSDERVVVREKTNAKTLHSADFDDALDLAVVDVSFIGIGKLLPALVRILPSGARLLSMVKPQFEAGRSEVSRGKGVIRDEPVRERAIEAVREQLRQAGFVIEAESDCRLRGPKGNLERFILSHKS